MINFIDELEEAFEDTGVDPVDDISWVGDSGGHYAFVFDSEDSWEEFRERFKFAEFTFCDYFDDSLFVFDDLVVVLDSGQYFERERCGDRTYWQFRDAPRLSDDHSELCQVIGQHPNNKVRDGQ